MKSLLQRSYVELNICEIHYFLTTESVATRSFCGEFYNVVYKIKLTEKHLNNMQEIYLTKEQNKPS